MGTSETNLGSSSVGPTQAPTRSGLSNGEVRAILGAFAGASVFVTGLILDPIFLVLLSAQHVEGEMGESLAYAALAMTVAGLCIMFASATAILTKQSGNQTKENLKSTLSTLSGILSIRPYSRVLTFSAITYAVFYALASGIVVYNPYVDFSTVYHVSIPSSVVATCCAPLGQTPLVVVYLTEHMGLLLVPANLLLLFFLSWLVGLNAALGTFMFALRTKKRRIGWLGGIGTIVGIFTSCPTCAGLAIFSILGGTGALSIAFFLGPLQLLLVVLSIPVLVASPLLLARSLRRNRLLACVVDALDQ